MKIAIEALGIHDYGGGRSATLNLIQNLLDSDQKNQYTLIINQHEPDLVARNLQQIILPIKNRFLARVVAQAYLPIVSRQFDLIHFAKNLGCFGISTPFIVTMYDMTTLIHPKIMPKIDVWYWQHIQPRILQRAKQVIAISNATREDIRRMYPMEADKIQVIYPSIHARFRPATTEVINWARQRYGLPEEYILHVGRIDRKNNISLVIAAFAKYVHEIDPNFNGKLVIVGGRYAKSQATNLTPCIEQYRLQNKIIFTGRVPDEDLPAIYSGARLAVMASRHEGFGLAAVEALACGTPLIAHQTGAIPEVLGTAGLLIKNIDKDKLAQAFHDVLSDHEYQKDLRARGLVQARKYQNRRDAEETLSCYRILI